MICYQTLSTNSLKKCMKINVKNLCVNSGAGLKLFSSPVVTVQMNIRGAYSGRSRPSEGGPGLQKIFFGLWASVWSKNKEGGRPLDLPQAFLASRSSTLKA